MVAIPALLGALCLVAVVAWLDGQPPSFSLLMQCFLIIPAVGALVAFLIVPRCVGKTHVTIGGDFIIAPTLNFSKSMAVTRYKDITCVSLDISKGRIVGATVGTRGVAVSTGRITNPAIVVRAIFERAPERIKWRRSWRPFK